MRVPQSFYEEYKKQHPKADTKKLVSNLSVPTTRDRGRERERERERE